MILTRTNPRFLPWQPRRLAVLLATLVLASACGGSSSLTGPSTTSTTSSTTGVYVQTGGTETKTGQTYTASATDTSAVLVRSGGTFSLSNSTITTSGNTSSQENSSFYGLNAAVLAESASRITLDHCTIETSGTGANGAFATGSGSSVVLSDVSIQARANGGHGVMATLGGAVTLTNVTMVTAGANSGVVATDRGGGTITMTGGSATASGQDSPAIYSTGSISITGARLTATGAEAAVIEGSNSITLDTTALSSTKEKWGVMIYQSMSGDASGTMGTFAMTGGSLAYTPSSGPLFYVTNSTGIITLSGVSVSAGSGLLLKAAAGNWGNSGSNGGTASLTGRGQTLAGDVSADAISSVTFTLQQGTSWTGAVNTANSARSVALTLDGSSQWTVTADSYVTSLVDTEGIAGSTVTNIVGNGHTVYYDGSAAANSALGGRTYALVNGGTLRPR